MHKTIKAPFFIKAFAFVFAFALLQNASANLVQDGDFSGVVNTGTNTYTYGQFGTLTGSVLTVTGWSTSGYNFVYAPSTADAGTNAGGPNAGTPAEAPGQYTNTYIWGPQNGSANGLPSTSPVGGNYIAMDGAFEVGAVTQTVTSLTVGQTYELTFYWAGAQQQGFTGTTSDFLTVSLGSGTQSTSTVNLASEGFSGWISGTMYFTATGTSEVLSFLANGAPTGEPPFTLLGGVDLEPVPDFSNWMVFAGFGAACIIFETLRRRRRRQPEFERDSGTALTESSTSLA